VVSISNFKLSGFGLCLMYAMFANNFFFVLHNLFLFSILFIYFLLISGLLSYAPHLLLSNG
jgi:hypothetical protein